MIIFIIVVVLISMGVLGYLVLDASAKKEVSAAPKVPMFICDIHGPFPASSAIQIEVPIADESQRPLLVDTCVFCYHEKMKKAEAIFKK